MRNCIRKIIDGKDIDEIVSFVRNALFEEGPRNDAVLEIAAYLKMFQPEKFAEYESEIIAFMGTFYKDVRADSMMGLVFGLYSEAIKEKEGLPLTPVQASMIAEHKDNKYFSFSAPTSTGKSFVFRKLIEDSVNDIAVVVPSRALINEYYERVRSVVSEDPSTLVLTFVDRINTLKTKRSIFILTPERARDLFKHREWLRLELVLFDEAQLSDDKSTRGLYFDSIVRRVSCQFSAAKIMFAHPFIENPVAQLRKNHLDTLSQSSARNYPYRNVGQVFYAYDQEAKQYFHFGTDRELLGRNKIRTQDDPVAKVVKDNGSVLVYTSKASIYSGKIFDEFKDYIALCPSVENEAALAQIEQLRAYIGATEDRSGAYFSQMIEYLHRGIVIHHGSIPLAARSHLEHFVQSGFCRMCFATSTLEQGINMPFDLVFLWRFEGSRPLAVKNLIGRAGRSTILPKFDFGNVVVKANSMSKLRGILSGSVTLSDVSRLDVPEPDLDEKYQEFKESVNDGTYSDEYNLTPSDLSILSNSEADQVIECLIDEIGEGAFLDKEAILGHLIALYSIYLRRDLTSGEENVFKTAIRILLLRWQGHSFHEICRRRFARIARLKERSELRKQGLDWKAACLPAHFEKGFDDLPDPSLGSYPLFPKGTLACDVSYDIVVFDTYDYLDRLIGFKLSDIFYAAFRQYGERRGNDDALEIALLFKYGTKNPKEIMMLRYGFDFEDFEWLSPCIDHISQEGILFNRSIENLDDNRIEKIKMYI